MAQNFQLPFSWLDDLANPHHDGTTQQIDDFAQAYVTDNQVFINKRTAVHAARLKEDEVWLKSQRDPVVKLLEGANKTMDSYISAFHYITNGHGCLPDGEATKAEAKECLQIMKDFKFKTTDAYGAESDKIIQMEQNLQPHQSFLTSIGAWTFFTKAVEQANLVRQYLGERALTKGEFVKGEMKNARRATDQAIAELYKTVAAMMDLMPSAELTTLYNQLKGIELYAKQYYLKEGSTGSGGGGSNGSGGGTATPDPSQAGGNEGGDTGNSGDSGESGGSTGGNEGGDNPGTGGDSGGGDDNGDDNNGPIGDAE